jgi:translation initiation factor 3 subunit K
MSSTPTKESVEALLSKSPYSASNQSTLEAYLDAEVKGAAPYYMDANRSLLKLYQIFPQSAKDTNVSLVLLLALLEFPSNDLLALSYLVSERMHKTEPVATILKCANLLESCQFVEFWQVFGAMDADAGIKSLASAASTKETLQRAIAQVLAVTYRTSKTDKVLPALNMTSGEELAKLQHPCVESVKGDTVTFAATTDNTKRNSVFQEGVNFGAIANMMAKISTAR